MAHVDLKLAAKVALLAVACLLLTDVADADADARRRSDVAANEGDLARSPSVVPSKVIRPTAVRRSNATRTNAANAPAKLVTTKLTASGPKRPSSQNGQENMHFPSDSPSIYVTSTTEQSESIETPELTPTPSLGSKIQSIAANNLRPLANLFQNAPTSSTITGRPLPKRRTSTTDHHHHHHHHPTVTHTATAYSITTVGQVVFVPTFVTQVFTVSSTYTNIVLVPTVSTTTNVIVTVSYSTVVVPIFSTTIIVIPRTIRA